MEFSPNDEASWRVTPSYPIRGLEDGNEMDWLRCATLHNHIFELAWTATSYSAQSMPRTTWWQVWITTSNLQDEYTRRLPTSLIVFLKHAYDVSYEVLAEHPFTFSYLADFIGHPGSFFALHNEGLGEEKKLMTLYGAANDIASHRDGIVFDLEECTAIWQTDIFDTSETCGGHVEWQPLEIVLSAWLDMIDVNKVVKQGETRNIHQRWPWKMVGCGGKQLAATIQTFDMLTATIEILMGDATFQPLHEAENQLRLREVVLEKVADDTSKGLVSIDMLDAARIPPGFLRSFLLGVRKPSTDLISSFQAGGDDEEHSMPAMPLFTTSFDTSVGLSLEPYDTTSMTPFEDTIRLVLPFGIGAAGYALRTDGTTLSQRLSYAKIQAQNREDELYQMGYCYFMPWHAARLGDVLEIWAALVGSGLWAVDLEGVVGGIEKWREADTEERYWMYQTNAKW